MRLFDGSKHPTGASILPHPSSAHTEVGFVRSEDRLSHHMAAIIADALDAPVSHLSFGIQQLREVAATATLTTGELDRQLLAMQAQVNEHAQMLDMLLAALTMPVTRQRSFTGSILVEDLLDAATREGIHVYRGPRVNFRHRMMPANYYIRGNVTMLKRAMAGLVHAANPQEHNRIMIEYFHEAQMCSLIVSDHPGVIDANGSEFRAIDEQTDLAQLSSATRPRLVPLMYAAQVAQLHGGRLEIKHAPPQCLAVKFVIPHAKG